MTFTNLQAKAARALLECSIEEVSKGSGVNKDLISRFERGDGNLSEGNRVKLVKFYQEKNIQFLEHQGVRFRPDGWVRELEGAPGFLEFMNDVYETTKIHGGEICVSNVDERNWIRWMGQDAYDAHAERMGKLGNFKFKILVEEGDDFFIASKIAEYRWLPSTMFNNQSFYSYGNKLAIINFQDSYVRVLIIEQEDIAEGFRHLFKLQWDFISREFT